MVKCGFCHQIGHNRRRCEEIRKLGLKGIDVPPDAIIEDFNDVLNNNDSDFEPSESSESVSVENAPTQPQPEEEVVPTE